MCRPAAGTQFRELQTYCCFPAASLHAQGKATALCQGDTACWVGGRQPRHRPGGGAHAEGPGHLRCVLPSQRAARSQGQRQPRFLTLPLEPGRDAASCGRALQDTGNLPRAHCVDEGKRHESSGRQRWTGMPGRALTPGHCTSAWQSMCPAVRHSWPCPGEATGATVSPPRAPWEETRAPTWIHTERAYFGGSVRLTMELQGYTAMQPGAEFTLFTISPAKQQPPCSQNPGWTLI